MSEQRTVKERGKVRMEGIPWTYVNATGMAAAVDGWEETWVLSDANGGFRGYCNDEGCALRICKAVNELDAALGVVWAAGMVVSNADFKWKRQEAFSESTAQGSVGTLRRMHRRFEQLSDGQPT